MTSVDTTDTSSDTADRPAGKLIVFEGGEGSGKTTQRDLLDKWCQSSDQIKELIAKGKIAGVISTREPGGTNLCQEIRGLLLNKLGIYDEDQYCYVKEPIHPRTELLLYAADRAQHVEQFLKPRLTKGYIILCDRFTASTVAYQGYGRELDLNLINQLNAIATNGLSPDLTLFIDVMPKAGLIRSAKSKGQLDRIESEDEEFHWQVKYGFEDEYSRIKSAKRGWFNSTHYTVEQVHEFIVTRFELALSEWYSA